jgi:hypothetical protein
LPAQGFASERYQLPGNKFTFETALPRIKFADAQCLDEPKELQPFGSTSEKC